MLGPCDPLFEFWDTLNISGTVDPILKFWDAPNISGTVEARNFKFGTETDVGNF